MKQKASSTEQGLECAFGQFSLSRFPPTANKGREQSLRAWDAADEYLLQQIAEQPPKEDANVAILNDNFGALMTTLHRWQPTLISDSFLAHQGCQQNRSANDLPPAQCLTSLQAPTDKLDLVLIKVPKTLALLEDQLYRLRSHIDKHTQIIAAGMVKHIHTSTLKLFEQILGPTHTSLAKKKARLIFCQPKPQNWQGQTPYPSEYTLENTGYRIRNHANVFSRASLDIGTRLLLQHIPATSEAKQIIDLGCGNGVVGLMAAEHNPNAELLFCDESFMALESAKDNFRHAFGLQEETPDGRKARFVADHCLSQTASNSADLIINNPPFHQQQAVGDHIAWQMFKDSLRVLKPGGVLMVIGNRHLGYHNKLKKLFGHCETLASDSKFIILKVHKR